MNQFELEFVTKEETRVPIGKIISLKSDKMSFSANCILSPSFKEYIQYLLRKKREEDILDKLLIFCKICLFDDLRINLNSLLSEYQYLNPLF